MLRKIAEKLEKIILSDILGGFISVMIPFVISGTILFGFIYMETSLSMASKLIIVWVISVYISAIQSFKFFRWWFKKKQQEDI